MRKIVGMLRDFDPDNTLDLAQLRASSDDSVKKTQPACEMRLRILERLTGPYYPGNSGGEQERRPVNLIELATDIYIRGLASHDPQVIIETDFEELLPTGRDFEIVLNRRLTRMHLKEALNICAMEALITMGVLCVGVGLDGYDEGSFAEPVLFPDLVLDLAASSWETQSYVGHDFLVPLDWVEGQGFFDEGDRQTFVEWSRNQQFSTGRDWNRSGSVQFEEYEKLVRLRQLYLPRRKKTVLFAVDGPIKDPLRVSDWTGPYCGPYIPLAFRTIPGNVFPLGPMLPLYDLDDFVNKGFTKAFRQAERSKTLGLVSGPPEDAATINAGNDGDTVAVSDSQTVVEKTFGGANESLVNSCNVAMKLFMYLGGNLDSLGGLAPSSGTVGQDNLLSQGAQGKMKDMQSTMIEFETKAIESIAFWEWEKPTGQERFTKRLEGTSYGIPGVWSRETRSGEFFDFNFKTNAYSRVKRSPSEQAQFITQFLESVVLPSIQFMQPGSPIDWEYFYKMEARYNNAPEIAQMINWPGGESEPGPMPDEPGKPNNTTRTYQRVNTQGGAQNPLDAAMSQFAASAPQNGQSLEPAMS